MYRDVFRKILDIYNQPLARDKSVAYLAEHLSHYLNPGEKVLVCFLSHEDGSISDLMERAVLACGAVPIVWGPDRRWMTLLRIAFTQRVTSIIGPPLVLLGLSKLRKYKQTPLPIRKVITAGYPCMQWMAEGIMSGMDCQVGGCFSLGESGVVAGFACGCDWGIHLRSDEFGLEILDLQGNQVPAGEIGEMVIYPKAHPELRFPLGDRGRISPQLCACGCEQPHVMDMSPGSVLPEDMQQLGSYLQSWTSILDCRLNKGECGMEMEIIYFQGEKLPKLPTVAKLVMRPWRPEEDMPFDLDRPLRW